MKKVNKETQEMRIFLNEELLRRFCQYECEVTPFDRMLDRALKGDGQPGKTIKISRPPEYTNMKKEIRKKGLEKK